VGGVRVENPIVGITMGDPSGIGPEIVAKALREGDVYEICRPLVIGDAGTMRAASGIVPGAPQTRSVESVGEAEFRHGTMDVLDLRNVDMGTLRRGAVDRRSGRAAVEYVTRAIELAVRGDIDAIATAPLNKEAMNLAGFRYHGHTELLAEATGTRDYAMMLVAGELRVVHVTTHVALREVSDLIKKDRVKSVIMLTDRALRSLGMKKPAIAVAGLNPHAGEGGLFGSEEIEEIGPAVEECRSTGISVEGPFPPDTVFLKGKRGEFDAVVAMYHDQGHIPVKTLGFEEGVNVTIGLPIIRTSVDHGTAFDIAWKGKADPRSMVEAIKMAAHLATAKSSKSFNLQN
jgi:4-hydroxythreonine-4-phosphate dehydrogenase